MKYEQVKVFHKCLFIMVYGIGQLQMVDHHFLTHCFSPMVYLNMKRKPHRLRSIARLGCRFGIPILLYIVASLGFNE